MKRVKKISQFVSLFVFLAFVLGTVPLSAPQGVEAAAQSTDYVLFDFTENGMMKFPPKWDTGLFYSTEDNMTYTYMDDGYWRLTSQSAEDPWLVALLPQNRQFSAAYKYVKIRYRTESTGTYGRILWSHDGSDLGESRSQNFNILNDGQWHEQIIEISNPEYTGNIDIFRLNPFKGGHVKNQTYDLQYIALFKTRQEAEAYQLSHAPIYYDFTDSSIMKPSASSGTGLYYSDNMTYQYTPEGYWRFTSQSAEDPFFVANLPANQQFDSTYRFVKLCYRTTSSGNFARLFWSHDGSNLAESRSQNFSIQNDGQWHEQIVKITNPEFTGKIDMFRLNPIKGPSVKGDTYDLKYMALFKTRADAEAYQTLPKQTHSAVNGSTAAIDDLGRELPMNDTAGNTKKDRYVGLFYFLWQGQHGDGGPYDNSKIVAANRNALTSEAKWMELGGGPVGAHHFWGEPLFGYYTSDDEWVMRKHVQMLTDADVDYLVFDTTNAFTYTSQALKLMAILDEYAGDGWDVPQVAFYTNSSSGDTMNRIYNEIYKAHPEYAHLWFRWESKPMIIGNSSDSALSNEARNFFRIKEAQWPNEGYKADGYPWMEFDRMFTGNAVYGKYGRHEVMNVSIAQHCNTIRFSSTAWYGGNDHSRSWHNGANDLSNGAVNMGYNFAEQWEYALEQDPEMIFITGWNEWVAQRQPGAAGQPIVFVDCADQNTSRDAEPMKGGHGDNYYMQMIDYIRRYKGTDPGVDAGENYTIDISGSFAQWNSPKVTAQYQDYVNDIGSRNTKGFGNISYVNTTGRNDIQNMKVARDSDKLYFYVDTVSNLTAPVGNHWMTLFINTGNSQNKNWKGYDYVLNRVAPENGKAVLEKYNGTGWTKAAAVDMKAEGNKLMLAVPRSSLGLASSTINMQFKWADNYQEELDIWTFYEDGDVAPYGRMNYVFSEIG